MIRINLLPQKRPRRMVPASEPGARDFIIGVSALAIAAVAVFLAFDMPKRTRLSDLRDANEQLDQSIAAQQKQLDGFAELKKAATEAKERVKSINRLNAAKVVPANVLHE